MSNRKKGSNSLLWLIVLGAVLGVVLGALLPLNKPILPPTKDPAAMAQYQQALSHYQFWLDWLKLPGWIFMTLLRMLVIPLVLLSMTVGVASLGDVRRIGQIGWRTLAYYAATTALAVLLGIFLVNWIRPGMELGELAKTAVMPQMLQGKAGLGFGRGMLEMIHSFFTPNLTESILNVQILPLILVALVFGGILTTLGKEGDAVLRVLKGLNQAVMKGVHLVIYLTPIGVLSLLAGRFVEAGGGAGFARELRALGGYAGTVILGLGLHGMITLPLILFLFTRRSPLRYARGMLEALTTAFSTASSSATLPVTMECSEVHNGVGKRASQFVLPLGATVNMDGTALYEAVAAIFVAQMYGIKLTAVSQMVIFLTATLAAIGAAGIPEAGTVTMVMVLESVGLPVQGIGIILSIDWFLDRCRTAVNVWGDSVGAAVIDRYEEEEGPE